MYLLLGTLALVPQLAAFEREFLLEQKPLSLPRTLSLAVGVAGAAPALVAGQWPGLLAGVCLAAWSLAEAAKQVWGHLLLHPGPLPGWPGALCGDRGAQLWEACLASGPGLAGMLWGMTSTGVGG